MRSSPPAPCERPSVSLPAHEAAAAPEDAARVAELTPCASPSLRSMRIRACSSSSPPIATNSTPARPSRRTGGRTASSPAPTRWRRHLVRSDCRRALGTGHQLPRRRSTRSCRAFARRAGDARGFRGHPPLLCAAAIALDGARYHGFNVLLGDVARAAYASNRASGAISSRRRHLRAVEPSARNALAESPARRGPPRGVVCVGRRGDRVPCSSCSPTVPQAGPAALPSTGVAPEWERLPRARSSSTRATARAARPC